MGTYRLTAHNFVAIRLFVGLIIFTPGTLVNIYILLILVILLDQFKRSWLATAADIWNALPADLILQGEVCGWHTIWKDVQRCICT